MRSLPCLVSVLALAAALPALAQPATPQPAPVYTPTSLKAEPGLPRTPDGHPDFQGEVWATPFLGMLTSPPMATDLVLTEAKAKAAYDQIVSMLLTSPAFKLDADAPRIAIDLKGFPIVRGERRSRLLVLPANGKMPFTPEALKDIKAATGPARSDNPEDRPSSERCLSQGAIAPVSPNPLSPRLFVQTREHVVIQAEYGDELRIIPFARRHAAGPPPPMGDSIAGWDGDTLVIETIGSPARERVRASPFGSMVVNPDAQVIERYTRLSKDELLYQFTVVDPKAYAAPWLAEYSLFRSDGRMYPGNCHEGNYSLPNILAGAREEERVAAAAPAPPITTAAK